MLDKHGAAAAGYALGTACLRELAGRGQLLRAQPRHHGFKLAVHGGWQDARGQARHGTPCTAHGRAAQRSRPSVHMPLHKLVTQHESDCSVLTLRHSNGSASKLDAQSKAFHNKAQPPCCRLPWLGVACSKRQQRMRPARLASPAAFTAWPIFCSGFVLPSLSGEAPPGVPAAWGVPGPQCCGGSIWPCCPCCQLPAMPLPE